MNKISILILLLLIALYANSQNSKIFLPELMKSYPNVRDITISPDGKELYFSIQSFKKEFASIVRLNNINGNWIQDDIATFSGKFTDIEPAFSPDGLKLYFASNRPKTDENNQIGDFDIWYVKRSNQSKPWSEPINAGEIINSEDDEFYPSIAANGNLYFTSAYSDSKGKEDIYICEFDGISYLEPYSLNEAINSETWEFNAYIAPDELYLIFSSYGRNDDLGGGDLYISFKDKNNRWTPALNLGEKVNSTALDYCPSVDITTNILYYTSERTTIPESYEEKQNLESILNKFRKAPNGLGRIYSIPFKSVIK